MCPFVCPLGPSLCLLITADSGIPCRQVRQIVRSTKGLYGFLPEIRPLLKRLISVRSRTGLLMLPASFSEGG